jgi:hypothetical protein
MADRTITWSGRRRLAGMIPALLLLAWISGCGEQPEIKSYRVSRLQSEEPNWRRLGAMIPYQDKVWYFKLDGPVSAVGEQKEHFEKFIQSIRFVEQGKEPVTWNLPAGWRQEPGDSEFRYATIRVGPPEKAIELTVSPLDRQGDDWRLPNVNRWRDQLGLAPIRESELAETTRTIKVHGQPATLMDLVGRQPKVKMPPVAAQKVAKPSGDLSYELPPGWRPLRVKSGPTAIVRRLLAFQVGEGDKVAEITVIAAGGDLLANVNRWRVQELGMEPTTADRLKDEVREIVVAGEPAHYVDLSGVRARTLAVMVPGPGQSLFLKMMGPINLVGEQKPAFEAFVKSVKYEEPRTK